MCLGMRKDMCVDCTVSMCSQWIATVQCANYCTDVVLHDTIAQCSRCTITLGLLYHYPEPTVPLPWAYCTSNTVTVY